MACLLVAACTTACATTITSDFYCNTQPGATATMMDYSYLEEPKLDDNGYTKGLKSGAFNYLVNGEFNYNDYYEYYDGLKDTTHTLPSQFNTTLLHDLEVTFDGEKGISEFYGKGFFNNYRALSAWKKIRYDDFGDYVPGESYMAPYFNVVGSLSMGPVAQTGAGSDYEFLWNATVDEGVIEVWDATGWTNKSVGEWIDWERTSLIKGSVDITNDLYSDDLYVPAQGAEDWLGCCFGGFADIHPTDLGAVNISCYYVCPDVCNETNCAECPRLTT